MDLVIIEGIGKVETIKKLVGSNYDVVATNGHVRDLPTNRLAVNILDNFEPQYEIIPDKKDIVKKLQDKIKKANNVYLASDPDREGEAISWHLSQILGLDPKKPIRATYNQISKEAVLEALKNPRPLDENLFNAQQARRILDRLVGYKLSPILNKKIQPKLSAGRVQSATLKILVDREREIRKFKPQEYWTFLANLSKLNDENQNFRASLIKVSNKKVNVKNKEEADIVLNELNQNNFVVKNIKKSVGKSKPQAPFTTSTMQQEASSKLGFNVKKVSSCAQQLYEGVEIKGEGKVALITYIRTDSVRVSPEAQSMAKNFIIDKFGKKYYPSTPNVYKTKKSAQDAHEAIRPINLNRTPEMVKDSLSADNYKLYKLIYNKFLASQMAESTYNSVVAEIENDKYLFKAVGKTPLFDGYTAVYNLDKKPTKKLDNNEEVDESENANLPELTENELLKLLSIVPSQKFTKPPSRFTEASLVKEMEESGIGRPSTYAATITVLANRKYTELDGKSLKPTELGEKVTEMLEKYFGDIIEVDFTASMENKLDEIAEEGLDWHGVIRKFYDHFAKELQVADKDFVKFKMEPKQTDIKCEKCGSPMLIRTGKFGEFLACSNYPACKNAKRLEHVIAKCPKCGKNVLEKKSKKNKTFYGCEDYPNCDFVSWEIPVEEKCPNCGSYMTKKEYYGNVRIKCSNENCNYSKTIKKEQNANNSKEQNAEQ